MPNGFKSEVDVAVVGAGAAGLGAGQRLAEAGREVLLLEAGHRVGGRALTEEIAPGIPFDMGCHWMHSASLNPFVAMADAAGFHYDKSGFDRTIKLPERWATAAEQADCAAFFDDCFQRIAAAHKEGRDVAVTDVTPRDHRWTGYFDYIISVYSSADPDLVSAVDLWAYNDTGEDWPLRDGYGRLVARLAEGLPVALNSGVSEIDWSGRALRLTTPQGTVTARRVILAPSTAILGGGSIRFRPELPVWKQAAVAALPLGCHNRIGLLLDGNPFGDDHPRGATLLGQDSEIMSFRLRPFGFDYVAGMTGGRFADWLERAGEAASVDLAKEKLADLFGHDVLKHVVGHRVSAWRGDPLIGGAYSAALPGQAHQRAALARPLDERLFFAGEATSTDFYSTAHGAYLSGRRAAEEVLASIH